MKEIISFFMAFMLSLMSISVATYSDVITAPIDSRPVSLDYLKALASFNNENFFAPDKDILDMFPTNANYSRFAQSDKVREQIREQVANSNNEDTTVIINTSSYMTGGLVGSRCGINYEDYAEALSELDSLVTEYDKPKYYINLSMPRTLPETRMNEIWRDNEKYRGLGYFYLQENPNCKDSDYISTKFSRVTPTQLIMEWSYTYNKKYEIGEKGLQSWEKSFLKYFERLYGDYEPYKTYISNYKLPFSVVSEIFSHLMALQKSGKIDEIVISNDDFQIPDFITYFSGKDADFVIKENGTPIKFSFARNYITNGPRSIYKLLKDEKGIYEAERALQGKGENINFIFGTDELPQLIYARNLSKRKNMSSDFNVISTAKTSRVATFDVLGINLLVKNDLNFICASENRTDKKTDLYIFDYSNKEISTNEIAEKMNESKKNGKDVGLIEIYDSSVSQSGENLLFKKLLENAKTQNGNIGINELACYSAWNTNANAIGLGVAQAQVYGIIKQTIESTAEKDFLEKHINLLATHCAEDGFYTVSGKRLLSNERFVPVYEDTLKSEKLLPVIGYNDIISAFKNGKYETKNNRYETESFDIKDYNFPWGRLFECYLDFDCLLK